MEKDKEVAFKEDLSQQERLCLASSCLWCNAYNVYNITNYKDCPHFNAKSLNRKVLQELINKRRGSI